MHSDEENYAHIRSLLPNETVARDTGVAILGERKQAAAAKVLRQCTIEYGAIRPWHNGKFEVDITVRCQEQLWAKLRPAGACEIEPVVRQLVRWAIGSALPVSFVVGLMEARAILLVVAGGAERPGAGRAKPKVNGDGRAKPAAVKLGWLSYLPDYSCLWYCGKEYDLSDRPAARWCVKVMVERKAVDEASALNFDTVILPEVLKHCQSRAQEPRIHNFFTGRLEPLRQKLIAPVARSRRFYLVVA